MKKLCLILVAGIAIAAGAWTLVMAQAQPVVIPAQPAGPAPMMPPIMTQPIGMGSSGHSAASVTLTTLSADTFASVKDHGDSQTVLIYKVDEQGNVRLTSKKKFIY